MESQPQDPEFRSNSEFRSNPENFHPCYFLVSYPCYFSTSFDKYCKRTVSVQSLYFETHLLFDVCFL